MISEEFRLDMLERVQVIQMSKMMHVNNYAIEYFNYNSTSPYHAFKLYLDQIITRYPIIEFNELEDVIDIGFILNFVISDCIKDQKGFLEDFRDAIHSSFDFSMTGEAKYTSNGIEILLEDSMSFFPLLSNTQNFLKEFYLKEGSIVEQSNHHTK